jgi:excisionase family DNA binding protein
MVSIKAELALAVGAGVKTNGGAIVPQLTVRDVAKRTNLCEKTIRKHIRSGKLNAANYGTPSQPDYRVSEADLAAFYGANRR